jgi:hypothetical protein
MPSTYSNLKIQLMATGENTTTWGNVTNTNLGTAIEEAIVGSADVAFSDANVTLTLTDTNTTQSARNMRLNLTGTATAGYNLVVPAIEKPYIINNGTDGTITVKNTTGTGVAVPAGSTMWVFNNGTNVVNVVTYMAAIAGSNTSPSYAFAGDLNTGMWSPAADTIAFSEGGVEAMRIDSSGNVGIGTTSPTNRLEVVNSTTSGLVLRVQNQSTTQFAGSGILCSGPSAAGTQGGVGFYYYNTNVGGTNGAAVISQYSFDGTFQRSLATYDFNSQYWQFNTNGSERMRITSAGDVGIGVTSPPQLLAAGNATDQFGAGISGAVTTAYFGSPSTGSGGIRRLAYDRSTGNFDFIGGSVASPATQMTITSTGNVGIGTTTPYSRFTVVPSSTPTTVAGANQLTIGENTANSAYRLQVGYLNNGASGFNGSIQVYDNNNPEDLLLNAAGGNVGIGTSAPTTKLDVVGSASFGAAIITGTGLTTGDAQLELGANRTGSGLAYIDLHAISGGDFQARLVRYGGVNGGLDLIQSGTGGIVITNEGSADTVFKTNATERMRITNTGNVGIGTAGPSYRLDIASGDTTASIGYAMRIRSNATATAAAVQFTNSDASAQNGGITCTDAGVMVFQSDGASSLLAFRTAGSERFRITSTGAITSSDLVDAVGYKGIPQNSQTATYTLALSDMGKHISITTGGVVIPANSGVAFPIGSAVTIFNNSGSSQTVSITTDTLRLAGTATTGTRTLAQYGIATVIKVTSTVWVISGAGVS